MMAQALQNGHEGRTGASRRLFVVLGMGVTGASCARWLARNDCDAVFIDTRRSPPAQEAIRAALPDARIHAGAVPEALPDDTDTVIVSPGYAIDGGLVDEARRRGIEVVSDLDLFAASATGSLVGITGSNGKSTVVSMVSSILEHAGVRPVAGGNIGTPALDLLREDAGFFVLELSSFQLERSKPLPLDVAVILNVSADHLDVHGTMPAYAAAKARVYENCSIAVVNRDEPSAAKLAPPRVATQGFGFSAEGADDVTVRQIADESWIVRGDERIVAIRMLPVAGRHNISNAMAAAAVALALGVSGEDIAAGLVNFANLDHRLQTVADDGQVSWIDDSKATNVAAAVAGIEAMTRPIVLIAGGDAKCADLEPLANAAVDRVRAVIAIGKDAADIASVMAGICTVEMAGDMDEAVAIAASIAIPGDVVLLSPACASLDMFASYAERGDRFAAAARQVLS